MASWLLEIGWKDKKCVIWNSNWTEMQCLLALFHVYI